MVRAGNSEDERSASQQRLPSPFALLIDADNTEIELVPIVIKKAEVWGELILRRAYGNQEALLSQKWKNLCLQYALQPIPHLEISGAKNATDIALAIDAIDLLHTQGIRRFCLVTGDQGFTSLVLRLRSLAWTLLFLIERYMFMYK
ncbi:MAG TPA: NYN domain-containing protein [Ktedonobacteraceae bacterium]|nr:NYN domain-containing protein [Ktedonobacteraceae bacterium]